MNSTIDINAIIDIAKKAGSEILKIYEQDFEVYSKDDASPLTDADKNANHVIISQLQELYPTIPFISEEVKQLPYDERKDWESFWLIDPLDGTKEFIKKNGEFTVNIALIENGIPVLGVVYVPVKNETYYAVQGQGAFKIDSNQHKMALKARAHYSTLQQITVVASRSHLSDEVVQFVAELRNAGKEVTFLSAGSSLKFCLVAEGKADVYPRLAPTMEWDTGAAHAVCLEAGKNVYKHNSKEPLEYNKQHLLNPWFIVE